MDIELRLKYFQMCLNLINHNQERKVKMIINWINKRIKKTQIMSRDARNAWSLAPNQNGNLCSTCGFSFWLGIRAQQICTMLLLPHQMSHGDVSLINVLKDSFIWISFLISSKASDMKILMSIFRILKLLQKSTCLVGWLLILFPSSHFLGLSKCWDKKLIMLWDLSLLDFLGCQEWQNWSI